MDQLSQFMITHFPGSQSEQSKTASIEVAEPTAYEKRAYGMALHESCMDESFLVQFEGTPLAPQAIALAEQELALEQRQLQTRMQQAAQRQNDTWEKDSIERDGLRLQKQQLVLELHKTKAMTPAPQPGDAVIGEPQPSMAPADPGIAAGGMEGGAPPADPMAGGAPDMGAKVASIKLFAKRLRGA